MSHDNTDEPTVKHESHAWAVLEGDTPLFHVPGTYPPEYQRDAALEALWRATQKRREYKQIVMWEILDLAHQEAEYA